MFVTPLEEAKPLYTIRAYNEYVYKIVRFKRSGGFGVSLIAKTSPDTSNDEKSDPALSRARRMVFEKALCNHWDYFFTGTLDGEKLDRYNLEGFHKSLNEFIKYRRRCYGTDLKYLLVPEMHKDGAWHVHGLVSGIPASALEPFTAEFFDCRGLKRNKKLMASDCFCWSDWLDKFGYCSLDAIKDVLGVSYYITKYISKELSSRRSELGAHLYYCSRGLNVAEKLADVYVPVWELDDLCTKEYEFCKTGFVTNVDFAVLTDFLEYADIPNEPLGFVPVPDVPEAVVQAVDAFAALDGVQLSMKGINYD